MNSTFFERKIIILNLQVKFIKKRMIFFHIYTIRMKMTIVIYVQNLLIQMKMEYNRQIYRL